MCARHRASKPEHKVAFGVHHHGGVAGILRGGPDHGGAADIDLLVDLLRRDARLREPFGQGLLVHHDQVDLLQAVGLHVLHVQFAVADAQQSGVNLREQRLLRALSSSPARG